MNPRSEVIKNSKIFKRWMFTDSVHEAEALTLQALLIGEGFLFTEYTSDV